MKAAQLASEPTAKSLDRSLGDHFRLPIGLLGRLAGWWMSFENARLNRLSVSLLDVQPDDDVLELGFGPGQAIELLVQQTSARSITGIDPSAVMLDQARSRNQAAIESGRVRLFQSAVERMPFSEHEFSKVFAVSNFHDWQSQRAGVRQVRRMLRRGGSLLICLRRAPQRPGWFDKPGVTPRELTADIALLLAEGFSDVKLIERSMGQGVVCLVANV
jgi:SAM-dependent methyltransferase